MRPEEEKRCSGPAIRDADSERSLKLVRVGAYTKSVGPMARRCIAETEYGSGAADGNAGSNAISADREWS